MCILLLSDPVSFRTVSPPTLAVVDVGTSTMPRVQQEVSPSHGHFSEEALQTMGWGEPEETTGWVRVAACHK